MNLRLSMASLLIRGRGQIKWLRMVDTAVTEALVSSMKDSGSITTIISIEMPHDPRLFRSVMSQKHAHLISELFSQRGDAGIVQAKDELFKAGVRLGTDIRDRLRLSDEPKQLIAAARLLYRILDIDFQVDADGKGMKVSRCSLAGYYGPFTCEVISRMDEGVVQGLNPRANMRFKERNGSGTPICRAEIAWDEAS